jgi:uncharacterized repeat protein (TIGR03803 family)
MAIPDREKQIMWMCLRTRRLRDCAWTIAAGCVVIGLAITCAGAAYGQDLYSVLAPFPFPVPSSAGPVTPSRLLQATDGNFYGTTYYGGASDQGTVFKLTPAGVLTTLYIFAGTDGAFRKAPSSRAPTAISTGPQSMAGRLTRGPSSG